MKIDNLMSNRLNGIETLNSYLNKANSDNAVNDLTFGDILKEAIDGTNETDKEDKDSNIDLLSGNVNNLHTLMINAEKADIALSLTIQIRNKVIEAYNEVMRMQV